MREFRTRETDLDLENVAATASMVPAMVAVITGGDPLTRPERAARLIERLSGQMALVLDTSGAGDIDKLVPLLIKHNVHVRVSIDSISELNRKLRPGNREYGYGRDASLHGATVCIDRCLVEGIPVTVQTVITSKNESLTEWRDLRDWLIGKGVRNWVLHVAVKGGSARRIEEVSRLRKRPRGILPSREVYPKLWRLVDETQQSKFPIDVKCTDTDTTPNSVLLIGSTGDLYTEGYAHRGKVALYRVGDARPDLIQALWPHLDRFGHARRYLNWNPWFFNGQSLEEICYRIDVSELKHDDFASPVETEAKYKIQDPDKVRDALGEMGYTAGARTWQRDEYFDTPEKLTSRLDYVVRLRKEDNSVFIALKGPRIWAGKEYSRIEIEVPAGPEQAVKAALQRTGFAVSWFFEKRRQVFCMSERHLVIALDEIPEMGYFIEIEGPLSDVREMEKSLADHLGAQETRNYAEVFLAFKESQGIPASKVGGAGFGYSGI